MTDREMLELAALAAGLDVDFDNWFDYGSHKRYRIRNTAYVWNPKHDDGDAFRLMVATRQSVHQFDDHACAEAGFDWDCREVYTTDPAAATRLAIVRAAAEIGRKMKEEGK